MIFTYDWFVYPNFKISYSICRYNKQWFLSLYLKNDRMCFMSNKYHFILVINKIDVLS